MQPAVDVSVTLGKRKDSGKEPYRVNGIFYSMSAIMPDPFVIASERGDSYFRDEITMPL
jgi:hypothetical protein